MKKRRRRQSTRSLHARIRRNIFIIAVLVLLFGWGIGALVTWPGFRAAHVGVSGAVHVTPDLIRTSAHITPGTNIWLLNTWQISSRIEAIPYVLSAKVVRSLPNRVSLVVSERHAESCVTTLHGSVTVDMPGRVLEQGCRLPMSYLLPNAKLPRVGAMIVDPQLIRLRNDASIIAAQKIPVALASFDRDGGLSITTRDGVNLLLGEDASLGQTAALLTPIFGAVKNQGRHLSQVDLRVAATPVVRYKDSPNSTVKRASGA